MDEPKPEAEQPITPPTNEQSQPNISGGVEIEGAEQVSIGGDVVGRDKIMNAGDDIVLGDQVEADTYIEHATIVHDKLSRAWLLGIAGVVVIIAVVLGVVAARPTTAPAPVLTVLVPTDRPTTTPLPPTLTPTATPIFVSNAPYRVAIAKFNQLSDRKLAIEQRLEDDLEEQLQDAGLRDEVEVKVVPLPSIESAAEAENFARSTQSNVVVWGLYDDVGIRLRVLLGPGGAAPDTTSQITRFGELPLAASGSETGTLSFYMTSTLPANTSFLSLYVIGHLYYLSNQYAKGHAAFDAATQRLPQTVAVENEAVLHFFNGRSIKPQTITDTLTAACEYAQAIEIDPQMFEAYNNLGVLLRTTEPSIIWEAPCMSKLAETLGRFNATDIFNIVRQIEPNLGVAWYNLGTVNWEMPETRPKAAEMFRAAVEKDPSIIEAYVPLGNMAIEQGQYDEAIAAFRATLKVRPRWPEVQVNLGQALALAGQDKEAETIFQQVIQSAPLDSSALVEAYLALGNLYHRRGDLDTAEQQYREADQILQRRVERGEMTNDTRPQLTALNLLQAKYEIDMGDWISATNRLTIELSDGMQPYVLHLLNQIHPEMTVASDMTATLSSTLRFLPAMFQWTDADADFSEGIAMADLLSRCHVKSLRELDDASCLPRDPQQRLQAVYDVFQHWMHLRIFYNRSLVSIGLACPYLFTYDTRQGQWQFDTTILYRLVGPEAEAVQERQLTRFNGRLLLREVEPEISWIDMIAVRLITADGREIMLKSTIPSLSVDDGHYLVLHQGDEYLLQFDVPPGALPMRAAWVVAAGYYVPHLLDESR